MFEQYRRKHYQRKKRSGLVEHARSHCLGRGSTCRSSSFEVEKIEQEEEDYGEEDGN